MKIRRHSPSWPRLLTLLLATALALPVLAEGEAASAASASIAADNVPVTLDASSVALLRGRWQGEWQLADGSRGQLRMQIQQAEPGRISGVLRYHDTAWGDLENLPLDVQPQWQEGGLRLQTDAGTLQLLRSANGYRLRWSGAFPVGGQAVRHELRRGAVIPAPLPPLGNALAEVPARDPGSALPANWQQSAAFMQIFVRAWRDSNGDGIGDLRGVTASLDYLQDLGIRGIWLMPILHSQDHDHGYAVMDYRAIEPAYGSEADLDELIAQAHKRGIAVIMDYVLNHSAVLNPLFAHAASSPDNALRSWFVWSDNKGDDWTIYGRTPWYRVGDAWYFGGFGGNMPDWNLRQTAVVDYHLSNLRYWLNRGLDGFRFDAVGNLYENGPTAWESQPENLQLMTRIRSLLDQYERRYMVCEAPHDPMAFARACGSAFAFGHNHKLVRAGQGYERAIADIARYAQNMPATMATLVSNHDAFAGRRLYDQLDGDVQRYALVAASYLTLPGIPFVYYGEEIGMAGATGMAGDRELRGPMSWGPQPAAAEGLAFTRGQPFRAAASNAARFNVQMQRGQPDSLHSLYRNLLRLRSAQPALARGSLQQVQALGQTLSFQRHAGKNRVVVVFNYGASAAEVSLSQLPARVALRLLQASSGARMGLQAQADAQGTLTLALPALSFAIYRF